MSLLGDKLEFECTAFSLLSYEVCKAKFKYPFHLPDSQLVQTIICNLYF